MVEPHRLAELRSLALHRAIAQRLVDQPELIDAARSRVLAWRSSGHLSEAHARAWAAILSGTIGEIIAFITADTEVARELRQSTPFAGALSPRARWAIWSAVREEVER